MKKQVVLALMLALGLGVQAQGDTTASITKKIEIQIEENTLSWNALITSTTRAIRQASSMAQRPF